VGSEAVRSGGFAALICPPVRGVQCPPEGYGLPKRKQYVFVCINTNLFFFASFLLLLRCCVTETRLLCECYMKSLKSAVFVHPNMSTKKKSACQPSVCPPLRTAWSVLEGHLSAQKYGLRRPSGAILSAKPNGL
jgi:hypothetical protein